jgi:exopolysaccharide biosynthesis polyprenyl glycosylphosphotransferase
LMQSPALGNLPVGFIDDDPKKQGVIVESDNSANSYSLQVIGSFNDLEELVRKYGIDEVFVTITSLHTERFAQTIHKCRQLGIDFRFVPNLFDLKIQKLSISGLDGIPLLSIKAPNINPLYLLLKRAFDVFVSSLVMLVFSPVYLLISFLIKRDSPGPIIFKQKRIGIDGKPFKMYKFRTMWVSANPYDWTPATLEDKRITSFGKFLRRTSLDELPQFYNVLRGNMSIVGPRPEMPFIVEQYTELMRDRLAVKPGITGLWQISADRGKQIHDNIEYDLYYIDNCGFLMDLVIIIRTIYFAIRGIGAF